MLILNYIINWPQTQEYNQNVSLTFDTNEQIQAFLESHIPNLYASRLAVILSGSDKDLPRW